MGLLIAYGLDNYAYLLSAFVLTPANSCSTFHFGLKTESGVYQLLTASGQTPAGFGGYAVYYSPF